MEQIIVFLRKLFPMAIMIFFAHYSFAFGYGEFNYRDCVSAIESAAFTQSLKDKSITELGKMIDKNINNKKPAGYNFIIIDELFDRNNDKAYEIINDFLKKTLPEIALNSASPYIKYWYDAAKLRFNARGNQDKLAIAFGEISKDDTRYSFLWELADIESTQVQTILNSMIAETNDADALKKLAVVIFIHQNRKLSADEFVKRVLANVKTKADVGRTDFQYDEWAFNRYARSNPTQSLFISACLTNELAKDQKVKQLKNATTNVYLDFMQNAITRQRIREAGERRFTEEVKVFTREKQSKELIEALQYENINGIASTHFHSPLHHLINNCAIEKVTAAIPQLFLLVDFTLDLTTDHGHPKSSGVDFFPAAKALIALRPPASVILQAMQAIVPPDKSAGNEPENATNAKKRLQLLTWILYQIEENDAELAKFILQRKINNNEDKNGSFVQALKLLEKPDELLPKAF